MTYRKNLNIEKVATGEHWSGIQALELGLVDEVGTSDDYLLTKTQHANVYEMRYCIKKLLTERLTSAAGTLRDNLFKTDLTLQ